MHDAHKKTTEQHELAENGRRIAAERNENGDHETGEGYSERALDYSDQAYRLTKEAHAKSVQIRTL